MLSEFQFLIEGFQAITWQMVLMWAIGGLLIWLAIKKNFEPTLLLPMGFGAILVNLPLSGVIGEQRHRDSGCLKRASRRL